MRLLAAAYGWYMVRPGISSGRGVVRQAGQLGERSRRGWSYVYVANWRMTWRFGGVLRPQRSIFSFMLPYGNSSTYGVFCMVFTQAQPFPYGFGERDLTLCLPPDGHSGRGWFSVEGRHLVDGRAP